MDRKESKKRRPRSEAPPSVENGENSDGSGEGNENLVSNFRMTLQSLDLQFTNICAEYQKVIKENSDLKRQIERLEGKRFTNKSQRQLIERLGKGGDGK